MRDEMQINSILIHRAIILEGLRALLLAKRKTDLFIKEEPYAIGYQEGFEDALQCVAQMVGLADDFESSLKKLNTFNIDRLSVCAAPSSLV